MSASSSKPSSGKPVSGKPTSGGLSSKPSGARSSRPVNRVFAYGDREKDGMLQMSFTLKVEPSALAKEAARRFAAEHGLQEPLVATMELCGPGYTYFVVYGRSTHSVDLNAIEVAELKLEALEPKEIDKVIEQTLSRPLVVVGACTGYDAHTVGIDAIINMKGFHGDKGLESYKYIKPYNLGAQISNAELIERAVSLKADAMLVSQIITQRNCHRENAANLVELLKAKGLRDRVIMLLGGPRIDHALALELGFDAGFGPGTRPRDVASFLATTVATRIAQGGKRDGGEA